jgi:hypothetical protein
MIVRTLSFVREHLLWLILASMGLGLLSGNAASGSVLKPLVLPILLRMVYPRRAVEQTWFCRRNGAVCNRSGTERTTHARSETDLGLWRPIASGRFPASCLGHSPDSLDLLMEERYVSSSS